MKKVFIGCILPILILSACTQAPRDSAPTSEEPLKEMTGEKIKIDSITIDGKKMDANGNPIEDPQSPAPQSSGARQIPYTTEIEAQSLAENGPTIYFFKANWCPTCKEAQKDLDRNITSLPAGTTIVTVNYDTESTLKKKYGITYQHTWVRIDRTGKEISKWNGGGVKEIAQHIETP